jgi:hypothetical protein
MSIQTQIEIVYWLIYHQFSEPRSRNRTLSIREQLIVHQSHEAANFMVSLFYDRISMVSKWCLTSVLASQLKTCA